MKKVIYILFVFYYVLLATNVSVDLHFCGGKVTDIGFFESNKDDNCACNKMAKSNCCDDVTIVSKFDGAGAINKPINFSFKQPLVSTSLFTFVVQSIIYSNTATVFTPPFIVYPPGILKHLSSVFLRI
ncbi:MAG: hypothetical protein V4538_13745 [Bacteroidota bacterium]